MYIMSGLGHEGRSGAFELSIFLYLLMRSSSLLRLYVWATTL